MGLSTGQEELELLVQALLKALVLDSVKGVTTA